MELATREFEKTIPEMMDSSGDSLSNLASSDDEEDAEDDDHEDRFQGNLSRDNEPGCVIGTFPNNVQPRMETFRQKRIKLA
jgi:hypothetical protein